MLVMALLLFSGCGAKKQAPEAEVQLDPGSQRIADWHALILETGDASEIEKLESVNSFFNQLEFVDDPYHWGKDDYW